MIRDYGYLGVCEDKGQYFGKLMVNCSLVPIHNKLCINRCPVGFSLDLTVVLCQWPIVGFKPLLVDWVALILSIIFIKPSTGYRLFIFRSFQDSPTHQVVFRSLCLLLHLLGGSLRIAGGWVSCLP